MDDFGTGYSSLEYLSKLPLSELKIDQSFVHNMHINARPTIIIKTIISMAKSLGLTVVAEGVETQIQHQLLQSFGCQIFQGYHFGRPMPAADCEDFLS
jgi:EAL domain-containing protein (putative c-di-GMP-specific phosphodiesterase class I)